MTAKDTKSQSSSSSVSSITVDYSNSKKFPQILAAFAGRHDFFTGASSTLSGDLIEKS